MPTRKKYAEQRSIVGLTNESPLNSKIFNSHSTYEQTTLYKKPNVDSKSVATSQSSKSSLSSLSTPVEQQVAASVQPSITIGEMIMVDTPNGFKFGKVKFVGSTEFAAGEWIGVALERPAGELLWS